MCDCGQGGDCSCGGADLYQEFCTCGGECTCNHLAEQEDVVSANPVIESHV